MHWFCGWTVKSEELSCCLTCFVADVWCRVLESGPWECLFHNFPSQAVQGLKLTPREKKFQEKVKMHFSWALLVIPATVSNPQLLISFTVIHFVVTAVMLLVCLIYHQTNVYAQKYLAPLSLPNSPYCVVNVEMIPVAPTLLVSVTSQSKIPTRIYTDQQSNTSDGWTITERANLKASLMPSSACLRQSACTWR